MNAAHALRALEDPFRCPEKCPFCGNFLDGEVLVVFNNRKVSGVFQTKTIGRNIYTAKHDAEGCHVPALNRLPRI